MIADGDGPQRIADLALLDGAAVYMEHIRRTKRPGTAENYERVILRFVDYLTTIYQPPSDRARPKFVRHITYGQVAAWQAWRSPQALGEDPPDGCATSVTMSQETSMLQGFLTWAAQNGFHPRELKLPRPQVPKAEPQPDPPSDELARRIVTEAGPVGSVPKAFLWTMFATGMRVGTTEATGLHVRDFAGDRLTIPKTVIERTKRHARIYPIGPLTQAELAAATAGRPGDDRLFPMSAKQYEPWLSPYRWQGQYGPCRMSPRKCRQWFCSALVRLKAPDDVIDYLMGHTAAHRTRSHYAQFDPETGRPWMAAVENLLKGEPDGHDRGSADGTAGNDPHTADGPGVRG